MIFNFYKNISNKGCSLIDNIDNTTLYYHVYNEDDDKYIEKSIYLDSKKLDICLTNISHNTIIEILQKTNILKSNIDYNYEGFKYNSEKNKLVLMFCI